MNKKIFEMHAEICKVFSNPKRLEILNLLREREMCVSELTSLTNLSQSNLSQHLAILRGKGVVKTRKEKANIYYRIANPKIIEACDLMREVLYEHLSENEKLAKLVLERGDE